MRTERHISWALSSLRKFLPVQLKPLAPRGHIPRQVRTISIIAGLLLLIACGPAPQTPPKAPSVPTPAPGPNRAPTPPPVPRTTTPTGDTLQTAQSSGLHTSLV